MLASQTACAISYFHLHNTHNILILYIYIYSQKVCFSYFSDLYYFCFCFCQRNWHYCARKEIRLIYWICLLCYYIDLVKQFSIKKKLLWITHKSKRYVRSMNRQIFMIFYIYKNEAIFIRNCDAPFLLYCQWNFTIFAIKNFVT